MTIQIPAELEKTLLDRAAEIRKSPEELVQNALVWYLSLDPTLLDELEAWQEVRDEALDLVEGFPKS